MITIQLTGNDNDVQKTVFVLGQLFKGVKIESITDKVTHLTVDNLPDNKALLALLKIREWETALDEIMSLKDSPIVSRETFQRLETCIEDAANLSGEFEDHSYRIDSETSDAIKEIERLKESACAFILSEKHPALKIESEHSS